MSRDREYAEKMQNIANLLDEFFNPTGFKEVGFALLVFPFDDEDRDVAYASNAKRDCMVKALEEFLDIAKKIDDTENLYMH